MKIRFAIILALILILPEIGRSQELMPPDNSDGGIWMVLSPSVMIGPTLMSGESAAISSDIGVNYSANVSASIYPNYDARNAFAIALGFDSRGRGITSSGVESAFRVNYLTLFPAFNWWQVATIGFNVGIPLSARTSTQISTNVRVVTHLDRSQLNILIEPKVMLAIPLAWFRGSRQAIIGWLSVAYPLTNVSGQNLILNKFVMDPFRLMEFAAGVGFSFDIIPRDPPGTIGSGM